MANPKKPLLNFSIDTLEREVIAIDKRNYTLRRNDDLTINTSSELGRKMRTLGELHAIGAKAGKLSARATAQLDQVLKDICRIVLDAPPNVQRKLSPVMRQRIVNVFSVLSLTNQQAATATALSGQPARLSRAIERELSGKTSSRGSSGSTADRRSPGGRSTR